MYPSGEEAVQGEPSVYQTQADQSYACHHSVASRREPQCLMELLPKKVGSKATFFFLPRKSLIFMSFF